jgi:hypothetical protein
MPKDLLFYFFYSVQIAIVQFLAFIYVTGIIIYTIYRESFCLDFLPHSENVSAWDEIQLRIVCLVHFSSTNLVKKILFLET